jgi:hypothetical protein
MLVLAVPLIEDHIAETLAEVIEALNEAVNFEAKILQKDLT